jgi:hypothetical protein
MSASFTQIFSRLEQFEVNCVNDVSSMAPTLPPAAATGALQFVSVEPALGTRRARLKDIGTNPIPDDEIEFPVVVGVGINYTQDKATLPSFHRYLPSVIDFMNGMRSAADYALSAYYQNPVEWVRYFSAKGGHPSQDGHASQVPGKSDYILIATNLSPFITTMSWSEVQKQNHANAILAAWPHQRHLNPLFRLIGQWVDLWIGHWPDAWPTFQAWRKECFIDRWMLTYNLSSGGYTSGKHHMELAARDSNHRYHSLYKGTARGSLSNIENLESSRIHPTVPPQSIE